MDIKMFADQIIPLVETALGRQLRLMEIKKPGYHGALHALVIKNPDGNASPIFYLDPCFQQYEKTGNITDIVGQITEHFRKYQVTGSVPTDWLKDFNQVKGLIFYYLINYEANKDILADSPHTRYLDLAKVYAILYQNEIIGEGTIRIQNSHLAAWGVTAEQIAAIADQNTPLLCPPYLAPMEEPASPCMGAALESTPYLSVLSNRQFWRGAAAICYNHILRDFAHQAGQDILVIPSSIHEAMLLPITEWDDPAFLKEILFRVNQRYVAAEEVLSDHIYIYRTDTDSMEII